MRITRRGFIRGAGGAAAALVATGLYTRFVEPAWLRVSRATLPIASTTQRVRVLHLSDLHVTNEASLRLVEHAIEIGLRFKPDFAVVTGDFITAGEAVEPRLGPVLQVLTAAVPVFASWGNHDGGLWAGRHGGFADLTTVRRLVEQGGVRVLENDGVVHHVGVQRVQITGLGDIWAERCDPRAVPSREPGVLSVLLSHNPDSKAVVTDRDWDVMLSGHTHGGQLIVPLLRVRPFVPVADRRFVDGVYRWNGRYLAITRGVGTIYGVRFNCRPELSVLDLVPPTAAA
jgi:uncharacterized protein